MTRACRRASRLGLLLLLLPLLGCGSLGYYAQAAWGGLGTLAKRRPIRDLLADPRTPADLREQLALALEIRGFATGALALPDNGSFTTYAELERPHATWTVVAAPELAIEPLEWCFPVAGCVTYRGYFSERAAERYAAGLRRQGYDVSVGGVDAYSTLGRFADPVLSTFLDRPEAELAGLMIHELAHQAAYAPGDTTFNESFATVVEMEGVARWLAARGRAAEIAAYRQGREREAAFVGLVSDCRERLAQVYASPRPDAWKRRRKAELLAELRAAYAELRESWGGDPRFDGWFARELNNAHLAALEAYHDLVPAFAGLLVSSGGDLRALYAEARRVAALPEPRRRQELDSLAQAPSPRDRPWNPPVKSSTSSVLTAASAPSSTSIP